MYTLFLIIKAFASLGLHPSFLRLSPFPSVLDGGLFIEAAFLDLLEKTFFLKLALQILDSFFNVVVVYSYFQCNLFLSFPYRVISLKEHLS